MATNTDMSPSEHAHAQIIPSTNTAPEFVFDVKEHMALMREYRAAIAVISARFEILDEAARARLDHNPIHNIESRIKTPTSLIEKLRRKGIAFTVDAIRENIFDIAGVRVVCNYLDDIEVVAQDLLRQSDVELIARKDYIANPKESGYRSLHLVVRIPVHIEGEVRHVPVEVQIRTIAMDYWASLEHNLRYKNRSVSDADGPEVEDVRSRLVACAEQLAQIDRDLQHIQYDIDDLLAKNDARTRGASGKNAVAHKSEDTEAQARSREQSMDAMRIA